MSARLYYTLSHIFSTFLLARYDRPESPHTWNTFDLPADREPHGAPRARSRVGRDSIVRSIKELEAAFHGKTTYETVEITPAEVAQMRARLNTGDTEKVDMVLMGCPHLSFQEIKEIACGIEGKKVHEGTEFWIQTSHPIYELAALAGYVEVIEKAGAMLVRDTCLMEMEYNGIWRGKHFVTNSGKAAQYAPAINGVKITMADMAGCVEAAVTGKRPKEA